MRAEWIKKNCYAYFSGRAKIVSLQANILNGSKILTFSLTTNIFNEGFYSTLFWTKNWFFMLRHCRMLIGDKFYLLENYFY